MTEAMPGHLERLFLEGPHPVYLPFLVLLGIGASGYSALRGERPGCVLLAALGVVWLRVDKGVEGDILVVLSPTHGITEADLLSLICFAAAGAGWMLPAWRRRTKAVIEAAD